VPDEKTDAEKEAEAKAAEAKKAEEEAAAKEAEAGKTPTGKDGTPFDPERAQRALDAARDAERKAKAEAKEAKEKAKKFDELTEAQKSDLDKAVDRAEAAEKKAETADSKLKRANLIAALADLKFGIVNARAAAKLIEDVEFDDEGEPTNLGSPDEDNSLIGKFLSENEYLRGTPPKPKAPSVDGKEGTGGDDKPPELTAAELDAAKAADMTPEEYAIYKKGGSLAELQTAGLDLSQDKT